VTKAGAAHTRRELGLQDLGLGLYPEPQPATGFCALRTGCVDAVARVAAGALEPDPEVWSADGTGVTGSISWLRFEPVMRAQRLLGAGARGGIVEVRDASRRRKGVAMLRSPVVRTGAVAALLVTGWAAEPTADGAGESEAKP
jgi:hypothetical protein